MKEYIIKQKYCDTDGMRYMPGDVVNEFELQELANLWEIEMTELLEQVKEIQS